MTNIKFIVQQTATMCYNLCYYGFLKIVVHQQTTQTAQTTFSENDLTKHTHCWMNAKQGTNPMRWPNAMDGFMSRVFVVRRWLRVAAHTVRACDVCVCVC